MFTKIIGAAWGICSGVATSVLPGVGPQSSSNIAQMAGVLGQDSQQAALITSLISSQLLNSIKEITSPNAAGSVVCLNKAGLFAGLNKKHLIKSLIKSKVIALLSGLAIGLTCGGILLSLKSSVGLSTLISLIVLIRSKQHWLKVLLFFGAVNGWFAIAALTGVAAPVSAIASAVFFIPSLLRRDLIKMSLNKCEALIKRCDSELNKTSAEEGYAPLINISPLDLVAGLGAFLTPGLSKEQEEEGDSLNKIVTLSSMECFLEGVSLPLMLQGGGGSKTSAQILLSSVGWSEVLLSLAAVLISLPLVEHLIKTYESIPANLIKIIGLAINGAVLISSCGMWSILLVLVGVLLNKMELPTQVMSMMYFGAVL